MSGAVVLVPHKGRKILCYDTADGTTKDFAPKAKPAEGEEKHKEFFEHMEALGTDTLVLAPNGGPMPELFTRLTFSGYPVARISWFDLQAMTDCGKGASEQERAAAIAAAFGDGVNLDSFQRYSTGDAAMVAMQTLVRARLDIQDDRKKIQRRYDVRAEALSFFGMADRVPEEAQADVKNVMKAHDRLAKAGFVEAVIADEEALRSSIEKICEPLLIWKLLKSAKNFDETILPQATGMAGAIGGGILGEIGDIRRFPRYDTSKLPVVADPFADANLFRFAGHLRSYAGNHVVDGRMPARSKGNVSPWNRYLKQNVWLFASNQIPKQGDPYWRDMYYYRKFVEIMAHEGVVKVPMLSGKTRYDYTLAHLDKRAKRWVGSLFLEYLWGLWTSVADLDQNGADHAHKVAQEWYRESVFPAFGAHVAAKMAEIDALAVDLDGKNEYAKRTAYLRKLYVERYGKDALKLVSDDEHDDEG